jgi:ribonucleoside-diphosphate reductase alpha chain
MQTQRSGTGLRIERKYTVEGQDPLAGVVYDRRISTIKNTDGTKVFEIKDVEVPVTWTQVATDILAQKYFRKTGVPQFDADGNPLLDAEGKQVLGPERSIKQVAGRLAGCWRHWGEKYGYFATAKDAQAFEDELMYMLVHQIVAPNSPQWFNTGLAFKYNIVGKPQGHWYADPISGELRLSEDAYTHPAPHACFIQSVKDDLVNDGGIFDLVTREARIFKYGSGTGTNFSTIRARSEMLSGGGRSSGLMSFLRINDVAAGSIKSGGTTRRAAKMVCLDLDHPEIETFIDWKMIEEQKVADLVAGSKLRKESFTKILDIAKQSKDVDLRTNPELRQAVKRAMSYNIPLSYIGLSLQLAAQGVYDMPLPAYDTHFEGEGYHTVSGQNSNNSVRIPNKFFFQLQNDGTWELINRIDKKVAKELRAKDMWSKICYAAWSSADPGVQYDDTINEWHTCPEDGRINASNPCSEYMFIDDTACNLASINLVKFLDGENDFDIEKYRHASRVWTIVLEVSVLMAQFPSHEVARLSYEFRTLGLGYANLGTVLMRSGIPYDSDRARGIASALTAIMCGESYATSAEMAKHLGPFKGYLRNAQHMLRVMRNHRRAAYNADPAEYEGLTITPVGIDPNVCPPALLDAARECWDRAVELGQLHGYRNAQVTVIAPTGTIGLVMDCDTTGVEPDFALVKFKKLAGGGYLKIVNQSVPAALRTLGYTEEQSKEIVSYAVGHATLVGCPHVNPERLARLGFTPEKLAVVEKQLPSAFQLAFVLNGYTLGRDFLLGIGLSEAQVDDPQLDVLAALGFSKEEIQAANDHVCGKMTIEGAPHLNKEDYAVFDCANKCGQYSVRFIAYDAHLKMMAAVQPFISGAISKTINMPKEATLVDVSDAYIYAWKLMIKAVALYRDGCKLSQPLNATASDLDAELLALQSGAGDDDDIDETYTPERMHQGTSRLIESGQLLAIRRPLPMRRGGFTAESDVGGHRVVIKTGEYEDGQLGEIQVDMYKEGASFRGLMNSFAQSVSIGLQHGVPLDEYVDAFTFTRFEPAGMVVGDPHIKQATSVPDYVFRVLGHEYLDRDDLVHVKSGQTTLTRVAARQAAAAAAGASSHAPTASPAVNAAAASKAPTIKQDLRATKAADAKRQGFTGEACGQCGSMKVKQNGSCAVCIDCGTTTGCS